MKTSFVGIPEALTHLQQGHMVILVDDEDRENEGDLVIPAEFVTPEAINFMCKEGRGVVCFSVTADRLQRLGIPMMAEKNDSKFSTPFAVAIEAAEGITTGVSVQDRCRTIQVAMNPTSGPRDIVMPGHVFPLRAKEGGVLVRAGHTEGSVDLMRSAGLQPAAVICEVLQEDGSSAHLDYLQPFAKRHGIPLVKIEDLIAYRMAQECLVEELAASRLPIEGLGEFQLRLFSSPIDGIQHVVLQKGDIDPHEPTLVRVHSECLTGDIFGSSRCDCGWQLQAALQQIGKSGGVLLYMSQEGRGIGLMDKIKAYALQDGGMDTVEANLHLGLQADHRDYGIGSQILRYLGITRVRLLTNNPRKIVGIRGYGLDIVARESIEMSPTKDNAYYLQTKRDKLGHILQLAGETHATT